MDKIHPPYNTSLGLAVFGIETGIDIWVDGHWFLTGLLARKYGGDV